MIDVSVFMLWLKRLVIWGAFVFVVSLLVPIFPPLGFIGGVVGNLYYWKNPGRSGVAVAVERELFLDVPDYNLAPYFLGENTETKQWEWCRPEHVQKHQSGRAYPCIAVYSDTERHCSSWSGGFSCNGIEVSGALWRDKSIRERIINAALKPCKYLYDPSKNIVKDLSYSDLKGQAPTINGKKIYPYDSHVERWHGAACQPNRVFIFPGIFQFEMPLFKPTDDTKTVFISISDERSDPTSRAGKFIAAYKAVREGDVIKGGYVLDKKRRQAELPKDIN